MVWAPSIFARIQLVPWSYRGRDGVSFTRWCVDSGANRDISSEYDLFGATPMPKAIRIGDRQRSFMSKAEGAILITAKGRELPLFSRVTYADQVSENIMSVEAIQGGKHPMALVNSENASSDALRVQHDLRKRGVESLDPPELVQNVQRVQIGSLICSI